MHLTTMLVDDVPEGSALRARLLDLTFGFEGGQMSWRFGDPNERDWIVVASSMNSKVIGWALVFHLYGRMNLHLFVDTMYRKCGVGTAIIAAAVARQTPLYVTAQHEGARRLFARFKSGLVVEDETQTVSALRGALVL